MIKRVHNKAEAQLVKLGEEAGWDVNRRGWPDFWCVRGDRLIVVEVKPKKSDGLKSSQDRVMRRLAGHGVWVYRWNPETGFDRLDGSLGGWKNEPNPFT
jgi:hypothetical protein